MRKLRNIGYLRFRSKIWQSFAVATLSLTPRLSFFPLWMLFAANAGGGTLTFILGGACRPLPGGRGLHVIKHNAPLPGGRGINL